MPAFQTLTSPPALYQGDSYLVWNNELQAATAKSERVAFAVNPGAAGQAASIELSFSGAPGAFEVDFQTSDTDADINFILNKAITTVNANNTARAEIDPFVANFGRCIIVSLTNAVNITVKITAK